MLYQHAYKLSRTMLLLNTLLSCHACWYFYYEFGSALIQKFEWQSLVFSAITACDAVNLLRNNVYGTSGFICTLGENKNGHVDNAITKTASPPCFGAISISKTHAYVAISNASRTSHAYKHTATTKKYLLHVREGKKLAIELSKHYWCTNNAGGA